ncbi:MAG TPA: amidohydrolase [Planctomycetaceae bacterium]|nr:amidohydrolase [Planctomycetaceae bacterium]
MDFEERHQCKPAQRGHVYAFAPTFQDGSTLRVHLRNISAICLALQIFVADVTAQDNSKPRGLAAADLAIVNATVLQCDAQMHQSDAVAVRGGRIIAIGGNAVAAVIGDSTNVIDAQGQCITPGLTDSHLHFVGLGQALQMLDLSTATQWEDIVQQVKAAAGELPPGTWIEGRGWHQSKWSKLPPGDVDGYPVHQRLSDLVPDHPVLLTHASGHACFANAAAMRLARVTNGTRDPRGGEILRDADGEAIGVFRENAQSLIRRAKARSDSRSSGTAREAALRKQIELAGAECLKHGITSVHDAGSSFALASMMKEMAEADELPLRIVMMIRTGFDELNGRLSQESRIATDGNWFTVRSVKVSIDGALGPHGAWLLLPYEDLPTTSGLNTVPLDELRRIAQLCKRAGWQLCVHAIGDRANQEVLDIYEEVLGDSAGDDHRWRIEHAQHLEASDIPRFGELGVIPAMQANHCTSDAIFVAQRLGQRRAQAGAYVWRSLIDTGAIIPNGTDAPVEKVNPRVSLYASVTRQLANGQQFYPKQCMTRAEALLSYTLWPAIAGFQERSLGSIELSKRADLVMWDRNLLTCPAEDLLTAEVVKTILDGKVVYQADVQ